MSRRTIVLFVASLLVLGVAISCKRNEGVRRMEESLQATIEQGSPSQKETARQQLAQLRAEQAASGSGTSGVMAEILIVLVVLAIVAGVLVLLRTRKGKPPVVDAVTKLCPKCRMAVPYDAKVCGHCRARLGTSPILLGCLAIIGFVILVTIVGTISRAPSASSSTGSSTPPGGVEVQGVTTDLTEVDSQMRELQAVGVITKISTSNNEVQVARRIWEKMTLDQKKGFTLTCAQYFKGHGQSGLATVVDNRSGKTLATNDSWGGIKINAD